LESSDEASEQPSYRPGSETDFERLYLRSRQRVLITLTGMLGNRAAAEDCTQEAFARAFKAWKSWRPEAPAEAWVHRIAINVAVSYWRRQRLREAGEIVRRLGQPASPPSPAALAERSDLVRALRKVPPKQAAALVLRHFHGYTNREIAASLGIPERTVASRLAAARAQLQVVLGEGWR
jgi:RNA polymerase sigma-70 factor (ECF subfamily)